MTTLLNKTQLVYFLGLNSAIFLGLTDSPLYLHTSHLYILHTGSASHRRQDQVEKWCKTLTFALGKLSILSSLQLF